MNCYDFELNISAYIEGELKLVIREEFNQHRDSCDNCTIKLEDISKLIENLPQIRQVTTSQQFNENLQKKIYAIDNNTPSFWQRLLIIRPLGFEPAPALGFTFAIIMIVSTSFFLLNEDVLPVINLDTISTQSQQEDPSEFKPSVVSPQKNITSMADSDSSANPDSKYPEGRIKLVGRK